MSDYYIGLMSGTSLDGIDAVIVEIKPDHFELIASQSSPIPPALKQQLLRLTQPGPDEIDQLGSVDIAFSQLQAQIVEQLLTHSGIGADQIRAIGSHGQTLRHRPDQELAFSLQIGDPNTLAELSGIDVAADFRRRDLAAGGQGAPLVPAFHAERFRSQNRDRIILNIGGMANITLLPRQADIDVSGFDTGPGNVLIDAWIKRHQQLDYDHNGDWARQGCIDQALLDQLLALPYFNQAPPKSTGREQFHLDWIDQQLNHRSSAIEPVDVQATLVELSARSISDAINQQNLHQPQVYLCGGGAHNCLLRERLQQHLADAELNSTDSLGLPPDWVEACAFAWLAQRCVDRLPGNLPSVTGASGPRVLGALYLA